MKRTAVVLVSAALLSACGSSYTRGDFIARANGICINTLRQARAIPPPSAQSGPALSGYLQKLLAVVRSELAQLRALPRPPGSAANRATLDRWFGALGRDVQSYHALASAAGRGDAEAVAQAEAALRGSSASGLAAGYGLRECASPGATVT